MSCDSTHRWSHLCRYRRDCRYIRPPSPPQGLQVMRQCLRRPMSSSPSKSSSSSTTSSFCESTTAEEPSGLNCISDKDFNWLLAETNKVVEITRLSSTRILLPISSFSTRLLSSWSSSQTRCQSPPSYLNEYWSPLLCCRRKVRTLLDPGRSPAQELLQGIWGERLVIVVIAG